MTEEARKDPESLLSTRLEPKEKYKTERAREAESALHLMVLGLDETPKGFTSQYDRSHPLEPDWTTPVQVGVERPHSRSFFRLGNFQAQIVSDVLQPCRFEVWVPQAADVGSPPGKTFVEYVADGTLTSPGGEAKEALKLNAACSYWMIGL